MLLLAGIFGVLLWMAFHQHREVGRFIAPADSDLVMSPVLDTATGNVCMPYRGKNMNLGEIPICSDLR